MPKSAAGVIHKNLRNCQRRGLRICIHMYTFKIRLKMGVFAHSLAGRTALATSPHLGKPDTAKTMPAAFVPISVAYGDFHAWTQLISASQRWRLGDTTYSMSCADHDGVRG